MSERYLTDGVIESEALRIFIGIFEKVGYDVIERVALIDLPELEIFSLVKRVTSKATEDEVVLRARFLSSCTN